MVALLHRFPHVIAWVAGHSHVNDVTPYPNPAGGGFWMIRAAAEADWPQQSRLLELFDNRDGTLSIFGTILDHASPATAPAGPADASAFDVDTLASSAAPSPTTTTRPAAAAERRPAARAPPRTATSSCWSGTRAGSTPSSDRAPTTARAPTRASG